MKRKIRAGIVSILLVAAMLFLMPFQALAAGEVYISDIAIGTPQELTAAGYTVVNQNLNVRGNGSYIGYQTTTDASEAITDVRALNMYGGYTKLSYRDMQLQQQSHITDTTTRLQKVVEEFKEHYRHKNPCALLAYQTLNYLMVPGENGKDDVLLGDYLLSDERSASDYQELLLIASNLVVSYLFNQLTLGVADDLSGNTASSWLERLCQNGPLIIAETDENGETLTDGEIEEIYAQKYDTLYRQRAAKLFDAIAYYAEQYTEALARHKAGSVSINMTNSEAEDLTDEVCDGIKMAGDTTITDSDSDTSEEAEECEDALVLRIYDTLNARTADGKPVYAYGVKADGSERTLAEFFIEVGTMTADDSAYRALYPLMMERDGVTPLSYGQEVMMNLSGFTNLVATAGSDEETLETAKREAMESGQALLETNDKKPVSVWFGVDKSFYDESVEGVYWTSKLARESAAKGRYDLLTKPQGEQGLTKIEKIKNAMIYTGIVGISALGAAYITLKVTGYFIGIAGQTIAYTSAACIASVVGVALVAVAVVAVVVIAILALVWLFSWLFDDDEEETLVLTEMPQVMYDYCKAGSGSAVIYNAVCTAGGDTPANLNDGVKNTPWVVLYTTKDKALGEPIKASSVTDSFVVQTNQQMTPDGYSPLCFFDAVKAANLNEGCSSAEKLFCFFWKENTESGNAEGQYIQDVILKSADSEEAAKTAVVSAGYTLLDHNLTADVGNTATYLGYLTSDNESDALTDLRVAYASGAEPVGGSVSYGGAVYGVCGNVGNLLLFETGYTCAGTPILAAELLVTDSLNDAPAGYEPVNLFCGGPAFDFNNCGSWNMTDDKTGKEKPAYWSSHTYVFFHPSVEYTSGTAYLGGLAFFSGDNTSAINGKTYYEEMGWEVLSNTDLSGAQEGTTLLCYAATYNPYRAIYDIRAYTAELNAQGIAYNLTMDTGYTACEVFQQGYGTVGNQRTMRVTHSYRSNLIYEGGGEFDSEEALSEGLGNLVYGTGYGNNLSSPIVSSMEWYTHADGTEVGTSIRCVGLYVTGCAAEDIANAKPILLQELMVSDSAVYDAAGYTPVRSFTDAYAEKGENLGFTDNYRNTELYLYIARPDTKRPKYIATVAVAYSGDMDTSTPYDSAFYKLVSQGKGQLITVNLAGDNNYQEQYCLGESIYNSTIDYMLDIYVGKHTVDKNVAYLWVTYTNTKTQGISDLALCASESASAANIILNADGATCQLCGEGFRVNGKGSYYCLYAVYNNGNPITDIVVDDQPMTRHYWTTLASDGTVSDYQLRFIKAKHARSALMTYYISGIYSASGKTEKEAQLALLAQGCRYCCPFNVNPDAGDPFYLGYSLSTSYKKGFSGLILYNAGQDDSIQKIISGRDTYIRVVDTLNSGVYDAIIPMFVTSSARKACENGATTAKKGHYITDIVFFTDKNLNEYALGHKSLDDLDAETRAYVESYILDDDGNPVYWDIVTDSKNQIINCNLGAVKYVSVGSGCDKETQIAHTDVYLYVHYSDNYYRDAQGLLGSVFANAPGTAVVMLTGLGLLLIAGGIILYKKERKQSGV